MKKLDKHQIKALAYQIVSKARAAKTKKEQELRSDKKIQKSVSEIYKLIEKIPSPVRQSLGLDNSKYVKNEITASLIDESNLPSVKSQSAIENEIIVASIDAEDVNTIINSINAFE